MTRILKKTDVLNRCGIGHSTLYKLIREGSFPKPVALSLRRVGWLESEVNAWIEGRIDARKKA